MAAIMLSTGLCFDVAESRASTISKLGGATADLTVNGILTTFRASSIIAIADRMTGLQPTMVSPNLVQVEPTV